MRQSQNIFFAVMFLGACGPSNSAPEAPKRVQETQATNNNAPGPHSINPRDARVSLATSGSVVIDSAASGSELKVPVIKISSFDNADYVQVLRCNASFVPTTASGEEFSRLKISDPLYEDHMRWIWKEAAGTPENCRFVGTRIARKSIQDLSAKSGKYYYLINPCVSKEQSIMDANDCSYYLAKTDAITYENNVSDEFIAQAKLLSDAEANIAGIYQQLYSIAKRIKLEQDECERIWRDDQARNSFFTGIVNLLSYTVGTVVGAYVGGPVGAAQGGRLAMGLSNSLFGRKETAIECKTVDSLVKKADGLPKALENAGKEIDEIRTKMVGLEAGYQALDKTIGEEFNLISVE